MIVLDTSVVSYIFSRDRRARYYMERIRGRRALVSFQTLEEVLRCPLASHDRDFADIPDLELIQAP